VSVPESSATYVIGVVAYPVRFESAVGVSNLILKSLKVKARFPTVNAGATMLALYFEHWPFGMRRRFPLLLRFLVPKLVLRERCSI